MSNNQPPEGFPVTFASDIAVRDIDLESEEFIVGGKRLTEHRAAEFARRVEQRTNAGGRPSLTAPGKHSPVLSLRVSETAKAQLKHLAAESGRRQSDLVREALQEYLERHLGA